MKLVSIVKIISTTCILISAMAFSCQDHHLPEPTTNCSRVDGSPRALNCEFEFVKADFYDLRGSSPNDQDTVIISSLTPASPVATFKEPWYAAWIFNPNGMRYALVTDVKVTIKRIAPPAYGSKLYVLRNNFAAYEEFEYGTYGSTIPSDESLDPVKIDIPVGATYTYSIPYQWLGEATDRGKYIDYPLRAEYYLLIQNLETSKVLRQTPHHYKLYRDLADARFRFNVNVVPFTLP